MRRQLLVVIVIVAGIVLVTALTAPAWWRASRSRSVEQRQTQADPATPAAFVGLASCAECHAAETERWIGSHHDLAMQPATDRTVLGDFDDATLEHDGILSTLFRRDGRFWARTDGADGRLTDFPIAYTFGVAPLQQYLVEMPDGRVQTLPLCWDTRPAADGGQRWFHIYPDESIPAGDVLHWTGPRQNWNHVCAECHSTRLRKSFDPATNRFATSWAEIDVSCEACHGPGSRHVAWAHAVAEGVDLPPDDQRGLVFALRDPNVDAWRVDETTGTAQRVTPRGPDTIVESCGRCHARRLQFHEDYVFGRPLLDTHRPALLTEPLYHADGQIRDEVYVYGSFLQSKMHRAGVTCVDCHDPHDLTLKLPGNTLCGQCHLPARFDTPDHHFHEPGTEGASCVACHMPVETYMVVDPRHDHSFRVPRPDLTITLGAPNTCTQCHDDRSAEWALAAVTDWYGARAASDPPHYGVVLRAGRDGVPGAAAAVAGLADDPEQPGIVRATALALLAEQPDPGDLGVVRRGLTAPDAIVRFGAVLATERLTPAERLDLLTPRLADPVRGVRLEAARLLADVPPEGLPEARRLQLDQAIDELLAAMAVNADRGETQTNLGLLYLRQGRATEAEAALATAIRLDPAWTPAFINLADLYRATGRDDDGERLLRQALDTAADPAPVHHALGLLLVRRDRLPEAIAALARATTLAPDQTRYAYVYAVAQHAGGDVAGAIATLEDALARHPNDRDLLLALASYHRDGGSRARALACARRLVVLAPDEPAYRQLLETLSAPLGPERP